MAVPGHHPARAVRERVAVGIKGDCRSRAAVRRGCSQAVGGVVSVPGSRGRRACRIRLREAVAHRVEAVALAIAVKNLFYSLNFLIGLVEFSNWSWFEIQSAF